jgi:hypothetical protein
MQQAIRRRLKRAARVHELPLLELKIDKVDKRDGSPCHYAAAWKCIQIVNESGQTVHSETIEWAAHGFDVAALVLRLLTSKHGTSAQAIFAANEAKAKATRRWSPGRPPGSLGRATVTHRDAKRREQAERIEAGRTDPERKAELRRAHVMAFPSLKREKDYAAERERGAECLIQ